MASQWINIDGSEDDEIHCIKAGEAADMAANVITDATSKKQRDDDDPFADIDSKDEEELKNNEILVDDC